LEKGKNGSKKDLRKRFFNVANSIQKTTEMLTVKYTEHMNRT